MDEVSLLRALAALLIVLGAIGAMAWGLKRIGAVSAPRAGRLGTLKLVEWKPVDARRKLAVVRWGEREHLVLLGPAGDVLIDSRAAEAGDPLPEAKA